MLVQATMLAIIAGVGILDGRIFGQSMLDRPIVTGMLVGLVLGDIKSGIMIGAQLELIRCSYSSRCSNRRCIRYSFCYIIR